MTKRYRFQHRTTDRQHYVDTGKPLVLTGDEEYLKAIKSVKVTGNDEEEDVALGLQ